MTPSKILFFDIESTNLNADFGYILCISWKWVGIKEISTARIDNYKLFKRDPTNDKEVVKEFSEVVKKADIIVGWYTSRFDFPFIQSRLLYHDLPTMPPSVQHIDGWRIAKYKMKLHSNRLASVQAFLGLPEKTPLSGPVWIKAMSGDSKSIDYIVKHCEADITTLEAAYHKLKPLMTNHPNVILGGGEVIPHACPTCGQQKLRREGSRYSRMGIASRYSCRNCGSWCSTSTLKPKELELR